MMNPFQTNPLLMPHKSPQLNQFYLNNNPQFYNYYPMDFNQQQQMGYMGNFQPTFPNNFNQKGNKNFNKNSGGHKMDLNCNLILNFLKY